ncbi:MAG TPA: hypothetical protein VIL73_07265 [Gaiellaceae bacterium]|jgi:hypothetical protein
MIAFEAPTREWTDHAESDVGIALIELAAYAGDVLSYYQEQIAAETRLTTRRRYASVLVALVVVIFWKCRRETHTHDDRSE